MSMTIKEAIRELEWAKNRLMQCSHMDNNRMKAFNMAIQALEKQVPKKVDEDYCCPICHVCGIDDVGCTANYCSECGQKLDWSEE